MREFLVLISLVAGWSPVAWAGAAHATGAPDSAAFSEACYWLEQAQVGRDATYQPGVDAYGREVAPADLRRPPLNVPQIMEFDVVVDLADDLPPGARPTELQQRIAHITLDTVTGEMWIDGEQLGRHDGIDLEAQCREVRDGASLPSQ